ncbi:MAG: LPS export ABC transporter periplasmic protein LptC [Terriglobia bacterium]
MKKTPLEMQEKRYDARRKRLMKLLGLVFFVTVAVIVLALWADRRHKEAAVSAPAALPHDVSRRLSAENYTHYEAGHEIFSIHAERSDSLEKGARMELEGVHVTFYGHDGKQRDEVSTERCRYNSETNALACPGDASVELASIQGMSSKPALEGRQPLFLETSDIRYDPAEFTVETRKNVRFRYGPASGEAVGLTYNTRTGRLTLQRNVSIHLPAEDQSDRVSGRVAVQAPAELSAGGLVYEKAAGLISLNSPLRFTQSGRSIAAASGAIRFDPSGHATRVVLSAARGSDALSGGLLSGTARNVEVELDPRTGQVRGLSASGSVRAEELLRGASASAGSLRRLAARTLTVSFAGPRSIARSAEARGDVSLLIRSAALGGPGRSVKPGSAAGKRTLTASDLVFSFGANGAISEAHTIGPGELDLLPTQSRGDRDTLTAGKLRMAFGASGRLEAIAGASSVRVTERPAPSPAASASAASAAPPRVTASKRLLAKMDSASGQITSIRQEGDFTYQQGSSQARADQAVYRASDQELDLSGNPEAWDPNGRIRARLMQINLATGVAHAWGGVQSVDFAASGTMAREGRTDQRDVIVVADQVLADREHEHAHYAGHVRAWRGADVLEARALDFYKQSQRVTAGPGVVTSIIEPSPAIPRDSGSPKSAARRDPVQPVTIRADRLIYLNLGREAVYEGNVFMISSDSVLQANRLEIYFSRAGGSEDAAVTKAVADGNVRVRQGPSRRASGEHAEYFAGTGKVVLTGGPPVLNDRQQGSLTGKRLTFFIRDASLFADGGQRSRTLSKHAIPRQ